MKKKTPHRPLHVSCNLSNSNHGGNEITDEYAGEIICDNCGVVLEEKTLSYEISKKENIL